MTLAITHQKVVAKSDGVDSTQVQPSNWNATHAITMATDKVIGRSTSGAGAAEEIACTAFGRSVLACADVSALLTIISATFPSTGDVKLTLKTTADSGWVLFNDGTIGSGSSGGSTRANADCENLFLLLWTNIIDTWAPVVGGRGVSAAADWSAHKRITLPKALGRALALSGAGSGLTSRVLGSNLGEETHALVTAELAAHTHGVGTLAAASTGDHGHHVFDPTTSSTGDLSLSPDTAPTSNYGASGANTGYTMRTNGGNASVGLTSITGAHTHTLSGATASAGSGTAHNIMQPTTFLNAMVKL